MNYKNYLKTTHWEKTRQLVLEMQKECAICGSKNHLNVHHKKYHSNGKSLLYNEKMHHLLVLCSNCHGFWHAYFDDKYIKEKDISRIKQLYWLSGSWKFSFSLAADGKNARSVINHVKNVLKIKRTTELL